MKGACFRRPIPFWGGAINIGIGISDVGLGAGFGLSVKSAEDEIDKKIEAFRKAALKYCN